MNEDRMMVLVFAPIGAAVPTEWGGGFSTPVDFQPTPETVGMLEPLECGSEEILKDIASQIHRNSEIANKKQKLVKRGIVFLMLGAIPWLLSMTLILVIKWH
jgi:hypothetical protein